MAVLALCNDFFRDCSPPQEYFDYGLYIPPDVRPDAPAEDEEEDAERDESKSKGSETPPPILPPSEVDKKKKEFQAKAGGEKMSAALAGSYAREQGLAPSQADIRQLQEQFGDNVTFADFQTFMHQVQHKEDTAEHLTEFFRYYDSTGEGKLTKKQMKNLLASYGEPLTEAEVDAIFKELGITEDPIDYNKFVNLLIN